MSASRQARVGIETTRERSVSRIAGCAAAEKEAGIGHIEDQILREKAVIVLHAGVAPVEEVRAETMNVRVIRNQAGRHNRLRTDQPGVAEGI